MVSDRRVTYKDPLSDGSATTPSTSCGVIFSPITINQHNPPHSFSLLREIFLLRTSLEFKYLLECQPSLPSIQPSRKKMSTVSSTSLETLVSPRFPSYLTQVMTTVHNALVSITKTPHSDAHQVPLSSGSTSSTTTGSTTSPGPPHSIKSQNGTTSPRPSRT